MVLTFSCLFKGITKTTNSEFFREKERERGFTLAVQVVVLGEVAGVDVTVLVEGSPISYIAVTIELVVTPVALEERAINQDQHSEALPEAVVVLSDVGRSIRRVPVRPQDGPVVGVDSVVIIVLR